jgi:glycogen synthase
MFSDSGAWRETMLRGMAKDFSWNTSARAYSALYGRLLAGVNL